MLTLDVYNTHMELYPYKQFDLPWLEKQYTALDKYTNTEYACGYIIHDGKLFLPRGTSISKIEAVTGCRVNMIQDPDPVEYMDVRHSSLYEPRNKVQYDSIEFLKGEGHQLGLNLRTGFGKTYCVAYTSTMLNVRTLIVTPNTGLKNQWIKTYKTMFDYRSKHLVDIAGSAIMDAILDGDIRPADVYFVNHQTLRSYLAQSGPYKFRQFFQKLGVGIKVYDESHMEFANILLIDFFSNTDRTWYLTATFDRSDKSESICFRHAFASVDSFGKEESTAVTAKHVIYHTVNINSRISPKNRAKLMGYPGFTAAKYGRYCIFDDPNDTAYKATLAILNKTKNMEGKTLIFLPLIDDVEEVVKRLKRDFPDKSVAAYHSKIDKEEKESAEKKDIIVSTIKSCGTGRDIKGLRCIICLEPVASKVVTEQTIGRLRPYAEGKDTYYFDVLDTCIQPLNYWHKSRFKVAQSLAKEVIQLNNVLG